MENKFSTMLNFFNKPINQADAFKQVTYNDTRLGELVFKDIKDETSLTKMPINKITRTIGITPSSKSSGEFEPIGNDVNSLEFVEPLYQNTIQNISVDELEFYNTMYQNSGINQFLNDKAEVSMEAYFLYVNNMKNMSLTGTIVQQIRDSVTNSIITGKTINYGTIIGAVDTADDSATFDISAAATTKEQFWNYLETKRKAKNLSTNGSRFKSPTDVDVFLAADMFAYAVGLLNGQAVGNAISGLINADGSITFGGYRLHDLNSPYSVWTKGTKDVWAPVATSAIAVKYIQMIDTVNGKHMQRNLRVATNDGGANAAFYMEVIPNPIKTQGWQLVFSAKPLIVFDTTASISRKIDT